jgi:hypothetical protein
MSYYLGKDLGDLLIITLNKSVPTCSSEKNTKCDVIQCCRGNAGFHLTEKMRVSDVLGVLFPSIIYFTSDCSS